MDAIQAVQAALDGEALDAEALERLLERLALNPDIESQERIDLIRLLMRLIKARPDIAAEIPDTLFPALLRHYSIQQALDLTGLGVEDLNDPMVRPVFLDILATKAKTAAPQDYPLFAAALAQLADPALGTPSVAAIDRIVAAAPALAAKYLPFSELFAGPAELRSRLIAANLQLLQRREFPASEAAHLLWAPLEPESEDVLLAALEIDYVGELARHYASQPAVRPYVGRAMHELCRRYAAGDTRFAASIETALSRLAAEAAVVFLEFDVQYSLVTAARPTLLAMLPADYIVQHHASIIERLELSSTTLFAMANIAHSPLGLELLQVTEARLTSMPVLSQLIFVVAATNTDSGTQLLARRFPQLVKNAASAPANDETRELLATFKRNMLRSIPRMRGDPQVAMGI